jgi:hypothetical protein
MEPRTKKEKLTVLEEVAAILEKKTFEEALRDGDIWTVADAAEKVGLNRSHLSRECAAGRVDGAFQRRGRQYFILRRGVDSMLTAIPAARAK